MDWTITDDRPIWLQLQEQLTLRIVMGVYESGSRLPSVRDLAGEAGVNPNTMQRALSTLEGSGLIVTNRTAGRIVTEDLALLGRTRTRLARRRMADFCDEMKKLGFSAAEAANLLMEDESWKEN